ncbi:hypothetical protein BDV98DRAFT_608531, partial [Pterulicium gracile]
MALSDIHEILRSDQKIVTFTGFHQSATGRKSTCGWAAFCFASVLFIKQQSGYHGLSLLHSMATREALEDCFKLSSHWTSKSQLSVDYVEKLPIFRHLLHPLWRRPERAGDCSFPAISHGFLQVLNRLVADSRDICSALQNIFIVLDSHSRPGSASLVINKTAEGAALHLGHLNQSSLA